MTDTSREAFETWCKVTYPLAKLDKDSEGYQWSPAALYWETWQASRKALEAEQAQAVEPPQCGYDETTGMCTNDPCCQTHPAPPPAGEQIDWQDMYLKTKSEKEAMAAKYEKDIGVLAKVVPAMGERLKVGDSRFENWYSEKPRWLTGDKQAMRDSYEAGLNEAQQVAVLTDIEQYRMQMAGISTAALGYWSEGDEIHPDYDIPALRDVARLYKKYDQLFKEKDARRAQQVAARPSAEVRFGGRCDKHPLQIKPCQVCVSAQQVAVPAAPAMTPERAAYFMRRFKKEEKLLGPNEQKAIDYVLAMLEAPQGDKP